MTSEQLKRAKEIESQIEETKSKIQTLKDADFIQIKKIKRPSIAIELKFPPVDLYPVVNEKQGTPDAIVSEFIRALESFLKNRIKELETEFKNL